MIILIAVALVVLTVLWLAMRITKADLRILLAILSIIAVTLFVIKALSGGYGVSKAMALAEMDAGRQLGKAMASLPQGPILVVGWQGRGYNPVPKRLAGLKETMPGKHKLIMATPFVEGMKLGGDTVKLDALNLAGDLRSYIEDHSEIAAVVVLRPIVRWNAMAGLKSPPFYIFADTEAWRPYMKSGLVKATMLGQVRSRTNLPEPQSDRQPSNMASIDYRLVLPK